MDAASSSLEGRMVRHNDLPYAYFLRNRRESLVPGVFQYDLCDFEGKFQSVVLDIDVGRTFSLIGRI